MADIFDSLDSGGTGDIFDDIGVTPVPKPQDTTAQTPGMYQSMYKDLLQSANEQMQKSLTNVETPAPEANALQRLLEQTLSPEEAAHTARNLTSTRFDEHVQRVKQPVGQENRGLDLKLGLHDIYTGSIDDATKRARANELIQTTLSDYADEIAQAVVDKQQWEKWNIEGERLKGQFLKKTGRRLARGSVMVVGGGLHLVEELQTGLAALTKEMGDNPQLAESRLMRARQLRELTRHYHNVLNSPKMRPVVENAWDKYFGGAVETAPFIAASTAPALLTGGATLPSSIGGFLVGYAVEGNQAYQAALDRGESEKDARIKGIAVGLINGGIEVVGGGGAKYLDNAALATAGKLRKLRTFGKNTLRTALREGLMEEVPQEMVSMAVGGDVPRLADGGVDWDAVVDRLMDTAAAGMIVGGMLEAPFAARHAIRMPRTPMEASQQKTAEGPIRDDHKTTETTTDTEGLTGFEDKQNIGVPDYVAPVRKGTKIPRRKKGEVQVEETKSAITIRDKGTPPSANLREETLEQLTQEYIENGMDPDKARIWAERTVGDEKPVQSGPGDVVHHEPAQTRLVEIPAVDPPPTRITDREVAESISNEYGISGQEAIEVLKDIRKTKGEPQSEADNLSEGLEAKDVMSKRGTPTERLNRRGVLGVLSNMKDATMSALSQFTPVERILTSLDGMENGPLRQALWGRLRPASLGRKQATTEAATRFKGTMKEMGVDLNTWMSKVEGIAPGVKLTKAQQIGVAMLAHNRHGQRYLKNGMKINDNAIGVVVNRVMADPELKAVMNWMQSEYQRQWNEIYDAAVAAGIKPDSLKQEKDYFPILRLSKDAVARPRDVLSLLTDRFEGKPVDTSIIQQRKEGAEGEIELDAFTTFLNSLSTAESFKFMAPAASQVADITLNPRFRKALNKATYGHGTQIVDRWVKNTVRGTAGTPVRNYEKIVRHARLNTKMYFIGAKVLSGARAFSSTLNAMAVHPGVAAKWFDNVRVAPPLSKAYRALKEEVESKSAMVKNRAWDRDIKRHWTGQDARNYLLGNQKIDKKLVWLINTIDKYTVTMAWKSMYDHAKMNQNMNDADAKEYADTWIERTQPMGDPESLPDFFRGGEIQKALTDFQQMPNRQWNFFVREIMGERKAGRISNSLAIYRFLMGIVGPAVLLGIINRGRLPDDSDEFMSDIISYPVGTVPVAGPWINNVVKGFDPHSGLAATPLVELIKLSNELKQGDVPGIVKRTATTVGSATGRLPHQAIISGEGAHDLYTGESEDPRRLLWTAYQLEEDEGDDSQPKRKSSRRRSSKRRSR